MTPTPLRTAAALGAVVMLLAGCSAGPGTATGPDPAASASPSAAPEPAPTSTLTAEEQQAVEEAAAVVLARQQLFYDLVAQPNRPLNDINDYVTDPQLELDLASLREMSADVSSGVLVVEDPGPVTITSIQPMRVNLRADPARLTLLACLDRSSASGTENGIPWTGRREASQFQVVQTEYLPAPGWAVTRILPPTGHDQPQPC